MRCDNCAHKKSEYAPFVKHGIPWVYTCEIVNAGKLKYKGGCKYWQKKEDEECKE